MMSLAFLSSILQSFEARQSESPLLLSESLCYSIVLERKGAVYLQGVGTAMSIYSALGW